MEKCRKVLEFLFVQHEEDISKKEA